METMDSTYGVHPVVDALAGVDAALDRVADAAVWGLSDDDLAGSLLGCERVAGRVAGLRARLVAEADCRDLGRRRGASSTRAWLRDVLRWRPGQAKWQLDAANRMNAAPAAAEDGPVDWGPNVSGPVTGREMPATRQALAEGAISAEASVIIARTMAKLPRHVSVEQGQAVEADLAGFARQFDPGTLAKLAAHLLHVLDVDTLDDEEGERYRRRELRLDEQSGHLGGRLDADGMATVRTALDVLAKPCPAADGTPDPRSPGQRLADALVELARRALASDTFGANHGISHRVLLLAGLDTLAAGHTCTRHGEHHNHGHTDTEDNDDSHEARDDSHEDGGDGEFAASGGSASGGSDSGGSDSGGAGMSDGADAGDGADNTDTGVGAAPADRAGRGLGPALRRITGTTDGDGGQAECPLAARRAAGAIPPGEYIWGGPVSAAAVRRITCTAGIQRVVIDPAGAVLDVGRESRTVTPAQYAALIARDAGCAFPGCTRPPGWCIAHHIIHWADGGTTDLDNLVLLCTYHHMTVHHHGWTVTTATDRLPQFTPPTWIDPHQQPRRNTRPRYSRRRPRAA